MPRNGSGTYTLPTGNPVVTGTTISSTVQNNTMSDVASALTQSLTKDGQTVPTANLPMGGFKLTNLGSGTSATDSANYGQTYNQPASVTLASAASVAIGAALSSNIIISGTTAITSFDTVAEGVTRTVVYSGAVPITYNSTSMQLFNAASRTNAAGDVSIFKSLGSGNWKELAYIPNTASVVRTFSQDFRLSLNTGVPVTTTDKNAATVIYMVPYKGNQISLYDGSSSWSLFNTTEKSITVPATTGTIYDVFAYNNSGAVALELAAWTNDTTRATALTTQDGVLVKSGATTRRYLGSFRTTGVSGQTEDSRAKRYVWNYYNRVSRDMSVTETVASWTYQTAVYRQANANAANQLDFIIGVSEDRVNACLSAAYSPASSTAVYAAIGFDSTTSPSSDALYPQMSVSATGPWTYQVPFSSVPAAGRHYITWLEAGSGGTITWYGFSNGNYQYGLKGEVLA